MNEECVFCKIVNGEVPCYKVWEDENVLAFLDIHPSSKGHTLIIPKNHFENIFNIPKNEMEAVGRSSKIVSDLLKEKLNCGGINLVNSNGVDAQQDVMHYHMHIIPRYKGENFKIKFSGDFKDDLENTMKEIKGEENESE